ncbi:MAG: hypothetical protein HYZ53_23240 [Planctomycetes bacterium]|nr:hypothetical protein [Planctomycetota bacterium]
MIDFEARQRHLLAVQPPWYAQREFRLLVLFSALFLGCILVLALKPFTPTTGEDPKGSRPARKLPPEQPEQIVFDGKLDHAPDGTALVQDPAYDMLLTYLQRITLEEMSKTLWLDLHYDDFVAHPAACRGKFVQVEGIVNLVTVERLDRTVGDVRDIYRIYLYETRSGGGFICDIVEKPPTLEFGRDYIQVTGLFYRNVTFENDRNRTLTAPFLFAKDVHILRDSRSDPTDSPAFVMSAWMAGTLFVVIVGGYFLVRWSSSREGHSWRTTRSLRQKSGGAARASAAAAGASTATGTGTAASAGTGAGAVTAPPPAADVPAAGTAAAAPAAPARLAAETGAAPVPPAPPAETSASSAALPDAATTVPAPGAPPYPASNPEQPATAELPASTPPEAPAIPSAQALDAAAPPHPAAEAAATTQCASLAASDVAPPAPPPAMQPPDPVPPAPPEPRTPAAVDAPQPAPSVPPPSAPPIQP